jgi:hypothetical protein
MVGEPEQRLAQPENDWRTEKIAGTDDQAAGALQE